MLLWKINFFFTYTELHNIFCIWKDLSVPFIECYSFILETKVYRQNWPVSGLNWKYNLHNIDALETLENVEKLLK